MKRINAVAVAIALATFLSLVHTNNAFSSSPQNAEGKSNAAAGMLGVATAQIYATKVCKRISVYMMLLGLCAHLVIVVHEIYSPASSYTYLYTLYNVTTRHLQWD